VLLRDRACRATGRRSHTRPTPRRRAGARCCLAIVLLLVLPVCARAAYIKRYTAITRGAITYTGNTLGLDKASDQNQPGTQGSIGAFSTLDTTQRVGNYPYGTTLQWTSNRSAAILRVPAGSTVLYAELIWSACYRTSNQNLTQYIGDAVSFHTPTGQFSVSPDAATAVTLTDPRFYVRSADVTSLVAAAGPGTYSVGRVPATRDRYENNNNNAGWTLAVIYENPAYQARHMTIFVGAELTNQDVSTLSSFSGFATPLTGPVRARMMVSATEGDVRWTGDQMLFGPTVATMAPVSGSRNPLTNFFTGQICDDDGLLDTTGTFGSRNHGTATPVSGARQGWDITSVDVSYAMSNGQTAAYARGTTNLDQYVINSIALQIDVGAPLFRLDTKTVDKPATYVGDTLTYTIELDNTQGTADATNVVFYDTPPPGTSFIPGTFTLDGVPMPAANPVTGVNVGTVPWGQTRTVTLQARVDYVPLSPNAARYDNIANWTYQWVSFPFLPPNNGEVTNDPPAVSRTYRLEPVKTVDSAVTPTVGTVLTYTVRVPNTGLLDTASTTLLDPIPEGTAYVPNSTYLNGTLVPDVNGEMPYANERPIGSPGDPAGVIVVGEEALITFQVEVLPGHPAIITNIAYIDPDGDGPGIAVDAVATTPPVSADLSVTKSDGSTTAVPGSPIQYAITVTNNGPDAVIAFKLIDTLPATLQSPTFTAGEGNYDPVTGNWTGLDLQNGESVVLTLNATVSPTARGTLVNSATVASAPGIQDPDPSNNTAWDTDILTPQADLAITKDDGQTYAPPGSAVSYTITVTNNGPSTLTSATVIDSLPPQLLNPEFSPSEGVYNPDSGLWNGLSLSAGESITLTLTGTVSAGATGTLVNSVTVSPPAGVSDPVPGNNTATDTDTIGTAPNAAISGTVYEDANHNSDLDGGETGTGLAGLYVKLVPSGGGDALQAVEVSAATGEFLFADVPAGHYTLVLDDNATLTDTTPYLPPGWVGTEHPGQTISGISLQGTDLTGQDFGLWHGGKLSGSVFRDDGAGAGTPNDGVQNGGEVGLAGVTVELIDDAETSVIVGTQTDANGDYTLWVPSSATEGWLKVRETNPPDHDSVGGAVGNSGGTYTRATDITRFHYVPGTVYEGLDFADVPQNTLVPNGAQSAAPGAVVLYPHTFTAGTGGTVSFSTAQVGTPALPGWAPVLYHDLNGDGVLDPGEPTLTGTLTLTAGEEVHLILKETIPADAPEGAQDVVTITATFTYVNATPALEATHSVFDLTIVLPVLELELAKSVDKAQALPGEVITYTLTYSNPGDRSVGNIVITDATPGYTTYVGATYGTLPADLTACTVAGPAVGETGTVTWTFTGSLAAGQSGTLTYQVRVD